MNTVDLVKNILKLKETKRAGWVLKEIPHPESVADHTFGTAFLALILADMLGYDEDKCVKMALIHDLAESIAGDITPHDQISEKEKHKREKKAIQELFENQRIISLWEEYEERKTEESKFVYQLDKLEMLFQAYIYQKEYGKDLSEFWEYVEKRIKNPELIKIMKDLKYL